MSSEQWSRVKLLFHATCDLGAEERAAFLDRACAGDAGLRREVESLLASSEDAPAILDVPPAADRPEAYEPGTTVGRYVIRERIGGGGMGEVYRAEDPVLRRDVALKIIASGRFLPNGAERFQREAYAVARLQHPNVVVLYDLGIDSGRAYLAMELLEGETLKARLERKAPWSPEKTIAVMVDVCRGLAHAHGKGIVHRDVKPGNIYVLNDGRAKVMDFGIASLGSETEGLTRTGEIIGTPQYIAPEHIEGRKADHRSDIYGAGVVLYELLAGRRPFDGDTVSAILFKIAFEEPPALTAQGARLPPGIEDVVRRAMARNPNDRFQDAGAMASALEQVAAGRPVPKFRGEWKKRPRSGSARRRLRWGGGIAAAVLVAALLYGWWVHASAPGIAAIRVTQHSVIALDSLGGLLWEHHFPEELSLDPTAYVPGRTDRHWYEIIDFTGDKKEDLVFAPAYIDAEGRAPAEIMFFTSRGRLRRTATLDVTMRTETQVFEQGLAPRNLKCFRTRDGALRVVAVFDHRLFFPSCVWLMDAAGRVDQKFVHDGHLDPITLWDADGDGEKEIVVGGTSNAFNRPVLLLFKQDAVGGASPPREGRSPLRPLDTRFHPLYYVKFINPAETSDKPRGKIGSFMHDGDVLTATAVLEGNSLDYSFPPGFTDMKATVPEVLRRSYRAAMLKDPAMMPPEQWEKHSVDSLRFWDGGEWQAAPTRWK